MLVPGKKGWRSVITTFSGSDSVSMRTLSANDAIEGLTFYSDVTGTTTQGFDDTCVPATGVTEDTLHTIDGSEPLELFFAFH